MSTIEGGPPQDEELAVVAQIIATEYVPYSIYDHPDLDHDALVVARALIAANELLHWDSEGPRNVLRRVLALPPEAGG